MARRSLLKMYNKMLDNMEGVQSTSSGHGLGNLHHATPKIPSVDNPDDINKCMSDMGVGNKRYDSDTTLCQRSDNRRSVSQQPLIMDSQPYIPPKFHVRRKEELPSTTPHWSSTKGLELQESVPVHLANYNRTENYNRQSSATSKRGKSPRVKTSTPKPEVGPYTPPQFFFTPQKYMEASKKEEVLINVDNRVPPSLQSWAKQNNKQDRSNREMESFKNVELENDTYYNPVREHKRNEPVRYENKRTNISAQSFNDYYKQVEQPPKPKKPSTPVSSPHIVKASKSKSKEFKPVITPPKMRTATYNGSRINDESRYWGNLKNYKKLYEKARWKETHANYAAQAYGNESWKTTVGRNLTANDKIPSNNEASKFVYGNDNWKKTLVQPPQENPKNPPKIKEQPPINKKTIYGNESWRSLPSNNLKTQTEEPPEPSAKISQQIIDNNSWEVMSEKLKKEQENRDIISTYYKEKVVNLNKKQDMQNEEVKYNNESNIWNDIEPFLPSFLSTSSTTKDLKNIPSQTSVVAEAPIKQDVKETVLLKSEASTNLLKNLEEKPVPKKKFNIRQEVGRSSRAPLCPLKTKEPEAISLFKHFQARSKHLRKQHSLLEKKKSNCGKTFKGNRQLSVVRGGNYKPKPYIDESEVKPEKKVTSYAPGTVCDIVDDGFKLSHSTEAFAFLQGEKYGGGENMFGGYQNLFNR